MDLSIPVGGARLQAVLEVPPGARGIVAFSHGSGSGRHSPPNRFVARALHDSVLGTLLVDLLTPQEDRDAQMRFDIALLTGRLADAVRFLAAHPASRGLAIGVFGASTSAASALRVAAAMPGRIGAVVARGGRPDLAGSTALARVRAPTLLIVGGADVGVIEPNEQARSALVACERRLVLVPRATHLFEESGALEAVGRYAAQWFLRHLRQASRRDRMLGPRAL